MFVIGYGKVVSRLPECVQQNINAQAPLSFTGRLDIKITKEKTSSYVTTNLFWDKHISLRMTIMLSKKCFKRRMVTQH